MVRTVYMNSDLQITAKKDLEWLEKIGKTLDFYGVPWKTFPYQKSPHVELLKKTKDDVVFLHNSLMCAGTIVDICSPYYQNLKNHRKMLWNFYTPTENYAFDVSWLPRAKDDNFSNPHFKGLNQPMIYMTKNGKFNITSTQDTRKIGRQLAQIAYMP